MDPKQQQLGQDFLMLVQSLVTARDGSGGMTWGDDALCGRSAWRQDPCARKNVKFKAKPGTPEASVVTYNDAVPLRIAGFEETSGGNLVDMTRIL